MENARRDALYGPVSTNGNDANPNKILNPDQRKAWGIEGLSRVEIIELGDKHPGMVFTQIAPLSILGLPFPKTLTFPPTNFLLFTRIPICRLILFILALHFILVCLLFCFFFPAPGCFRDPTDSCQKKTLFFLQGVIMLCGGCLCSIIPLFCRLLAVPEGLCE